MLIIKNEIRLIKSVFVLLMLIFVQNSAASDESSYLEYIAPGKYNQKVIAVVASSPSETEQTLLVERYGSRLSEDEFYSDVYLLRGKYSHKLLSSKISNISSARSYEIDEDRYFIEVRDVHKWHYFVYSKSNNKIRTLDKDMVDKADFEPFFISSNKSQLFFKGDNKEIIFEDEKAILEISDYKVYKESAVVVGLAYSSQDENIRYLWQVRLDADAPPVIYKLPLEENKTYEVSLVPSVRLPEYMKLGFSFDKDPSSPGLRLASGVHFVNSSGKIVHQENNLSFDKVVYNKEVQVCSNNILVFERIYKNNEKLSSIYAKILKANGSSIDIGKIEAVSSGVLSTYFADALDKNTAVVYVNFSRIESERRPDGWVFWSGFVVKEVQLDCSNYVAID